MSGEASASKVSPSNPAAFIPHLTQLLDTLTTSASSLPPKSDLAFHRTLDRQFAKNLDATSARVLGLAERLLAHADQSGVGKKGGKRRTGSGKARRKLVDEDDVTEGYRRTVGEVVDGLLEDADSCLDEMNGQKRKAAIEVAPERVKHAGDKLPGPIEQKKSASSRGNFNFMATPDDYPKPQLLFSDAVDNSLSRPPWEPTITTKLHGTTPLGIHTPDPLPLPSQGESDAAGMQSREEKEKRKVLHPYYLETRKLKHSPALFQPVVPQPPRSYADTPFTMVETPSQVEEMVQHLKSVTEIAVDLEHHDYRSYYGFTCLIQISTRERDFVVDPLKVRAELREGKLGGVMVDPNIVKVMHGANSDIVWLQKDFEIYVVNLFDTYHASHLLGLPQHSLKSLLLKYCDYHTDKRYQMADWRIRPLPTEMLEYARSDTHFLLYIYDRLREELLLKDPASRKGPIQMVFQHSADVSLKMYERETYEEDTGKGSNGWLAPGRKWLRSALGEEAGLVWKRLHMWRDAVARKEDESWVYVMSQDALRNLCLRLPTTTNAVKTIVRPNSRVAWRRPLEVLKVINDARVEWRTSGEVPVVAGLPTAASSRSSPGPSLTASSSTAPSKVASPAPEASSSASVFQRPSRAPDDLWAGLSSSTSPAPRQSALFGGTASPRRGPAAPGARNGSALFGSGLLSANGLSTAGRRKSPGFEQVMATIHSRIAGGSHVASPERTQQTEAATKGTMPATTAPSAQPVFREVVSEIPEDTPTESTADEPTDTIVKVKRSKGKRARDLTNGSTSSPGKKQRTSSDEKDVPSVSALNLNGSADLKAAEQTPKKDKKDKKVRPRPEDIPTFDYASQPNLLDHPESSSPNETKKGKNARRKEKKRQMEAMQGSNARTGAPVITDTKFGVVSKGKSERKEGNKSKTFHA